VEQLLETYFMNLDNTWNRLQTLAEYVDDTEDYIKFDIDTKRNQFIEVLSYFRLHRRHVWRLWLCDIKFIVWRHAPHVMCKASLGQT